MTELLTKEEIANLKAGFWPIGMYQGRPPEGLERLLATLDERDAEIERLTEKHARSVECLRHRIAHEKWHRRQGIRERKRLRAVITEMERAAIANRAALGADERKIARLTERAEKAEAERDALISEIERREKTILEAWAERDAYRSALNETQRAMNEAWRALTAGEPSGTAQHIAGLLEAHCIVAGAERDAAQEENDNMLRTVTELREELGIVGKDPKRVAVMDGGELRPVADVMAERDAYRENLHVAKRQYENLKDERDALASKLAAVAEAYEHMTEAALCAEAGCHTPDEVREQIEAASIEVFDIEAAAKARDDALVAEHKARADALAERLETLRGALPAKRAPGPVAYFESLERIRALLDDTEAAAKARDEALVERAMHATYTLLHPDEDPARERLDPSQVRYLLARLFPDPEPTDDDIKAEVRRRMMVDPKPTDEGGSDDGDT